MKDYRAAQPRSRVELAWTHQWLPARELEIIEPLIAARCLQSSEHEA